MPITTLAIRSFISRRSDPFPIYADAKFMYHSAYLRSAKTCFITLGLQANQKLPEYELVFKNPL